MTKLISTDQVAALRAHVFDAVTSWNAAHPGVPGSRRERASVSVTEVYGDATAAPSYTITVVCPLGGSTPLTFHGPVLTTVAEQAYLTIERKIATELLPMVAPPSAVASLAARTR